MSTLHTRGTLERELERTRSDILRMGSLVENAIERSVQALKTRDYDLAQQVVNDDDTINRLRYDIEEQCLALIATQQPAASDLRTTIAVTHIAVELERIADHAEGIAEIAKRIFDEPLLKPLITLIPAPDWSAKQMDLRVAPVADLPLVAFFLFVAYDLVNRPERNPS